VRALVLVVAALALLGVGGWALSSARHASSATRHGSLAATESKEPIRLNASVPSYSSQRVRFAGVLTERTLKWELENGSKLGRASFVLTSGRQRLRLCKSCRVVELGSVAMDAHAARAAAAGKAVLIVETHSGRQAHYSVRAQRCSCAAGLYFSAPSLTR
jgi:hypothetical protein